jgi:DNA-binding transcriptional LysR family regulator
VRELSGTSAALTEGHQPAMSPLSRRTENCDPAIRASVALLLPYRTLEDEEEAVDMFLHDHLDIAYAVEGFEPVLLHVNPSLPSTFSDGGIGNPRTAIPPETFQQILPVEVELRPSIPTFDFHIAWRRDNQSRVLHAFLEMLREHAHAEAKGPEKTAIAKHSDRYLHRRSQREVGAGKSDRKTTTNGR